MQEICSGFHAHSYAIVSCMNIQLFVYTESASFSLTSHGQHIAPLQPTINQFGYFLIFVLMLKLKLFLCNTIVIFQGKQNNCLYWKNRRPLNKSSYIYLNAEAVHIIPKNTPNISSHHHCVYRNIMTVVDPQSVMATKGLCKWRLGRDTDSPSKSNNHPKIHI